MLYYNLFRKSFTAMTSRSSLDQEDSRRLSMYEHLYQFFSGAQWGYDRTDDEDLVTVNMCETVVDKHATFLAGRGFYLKDSEGTSDRAEIQFVDSAWDRSGKFSTFYAIAQNGSLFGDAYAAVFPNAAGDPQVYQYAAPYVHPVHHADDPSIIVSALVEYPVQSKLSPNPDVITIQMDGQTIVKYVNNLKVEEHFHNFGEAPLVHIPNRPFPGTVFGRSDIAGITKLQQHFNSKMTDNSDIIAYHASPLTLGYGVTIEQLERGVDRIISGLDADAKVENLEAKGDMKGSIEYAKMIKKLIHQVSGVPEIAFGAADELKFSNSSGLALQLLFQPMLDILKVKHGYYSEGLEKVNKLIIKWGVRTLQLIPPIGKERLERFYKVEVDFPNPLPKDELLALNIIIMKLEKGLMTMEEAHQELGRLKVKEYMDKVLKEIEQGVNLVYLAAHQKKEVETQTNIGGVMRDGDTVRQSLQQDERSFGSAAAAA